MVHRTLAETCEDYLKEKKRHGKGTMGVRYIQTSILYIG
jgi:hypothetical protein